MMNSLRNRYFRSQLIALLAMVTVCSGASTSWAVINGDFNLMIGESPRYLDAILKFKRQEITASELYVIKYEESCKNPSLRLWDRNRPALLLQNTSDEENFVSSFVIDIKQAGYAFGTGDGAGDGFTSYVQQDPRSDAGVTVSANLIADDPTKLQLNFTGLSKGKAALFRIDLDPVPVVNVLYPDYRGIILGADTGQGPTDPALISATFSRDGMPDATTPAAPFNGNIQTTISSGMLEVYATQSRTDMFDFNGGTVIPEPATVSLLALAGAGICCRRRRCA